MNEAAVALAYKQCEEITRSRARNFYYGIRLLPPPKRSAMCALYAMARRIDDIGDSSGEKGAGNGGASNGGASNGGASNGGASNGGASNGGASNGGASNGGASNGGAGDNETEVAALSLASVRASLALVTKAASGGPPPPPGDPVLMATADAARRFPLPIEALEELVEGCEWDLHGRRYETFEELVEYCRRVAGTIGRLSLAIYGTSNHGSPNHGSPDDRRAEGLADSLGVALQLTNILRDVVEDRDSLGRVYLPREDLARFGVGEDLEGDYDDLMALVCYESARAAEWYERGLPLLGLLDRRSRACTAAMAGIYRRLLVKIRLAPGSVLERRVSLASGQKVVVAATALMKGAA